MHVSSSVRPERDPRRGASCMDSGQRTSSLHVHDGHDGYGGVLCLILREKRDGGATGGRWLARARWIYGSPVVPCAWGAPPLRPGTASEPLLSQQDHAAMFDSCGGM